ncbi:putative sensor domain DACNV-containing protein [Mucilaginibacter sp.]|uniref:putative sensor domain DACNV-containing protein n=1 Tax=Mucilaginibacter sp. TaxID=1882438 RepID=UPI003D0D6670
MTYRSTYQGASVVAPAIEKHFSKLLAMALQQGGEDLAPEPSLKVIEAIIDVSFWASLRREEGRSPKVSLAYLPPILAGQPLLFEERILLTPHVLNKLAPAVERSGIHLGVWDQDGELYVWGTTRSIPDCCFVLEVIEPGLLVVKHRRIKGFGKFINVAVLKGDEVKIIDELSKSLPDCPAMLTSLLDYNSPTGWNDSVNVLVQLAASMRLHGHGGTLLVVPSDSDAWRDSIIHPITYPVDPAFSELKKLMSQVVNEQSMSLWQDEVNRTVDSVAGLTAVDGATIINNELELLAFGAKIGLSSNGMPVEEMMTTEPIVGSSALIVHPSQNGGTRHLSAAQFVFDQRDAIALVSSQDGRFTIFSWSPCENIVHAHYVDALLL